MFKWLRELFMIRRAPQQPLVDRRVVDSPMDQGDYHSGPEGYSPNTAYPETQYGSMFDEDADWNEGEWR